MNSVFCPVCGKETDFDYCADLEENSITVKVFCMECDYETSKTFYTQDMIDNS